MSDRIAKVNEFILHALGEIIERELSLKRGVLVTLTRVDTTRDLRYTRVFVSAYPESERDYVLQTLRHEESRLQRALHGRLTTKIKPALSLALDTTESDADEVEYLLKKIAEESPPA